MDTELAFLKRWLREGKNAAIAIVVEKKGSGLRPTGAKMIISGQSEMHGSVSGGCVESAVVEEALACLTSGQPKRLHYGISDDTAWSVGLMCGGEIDIFILPIRLEDEPDFNTDLIDRMFDLFGKRQEFLLLIVLDGQYSGQVCIQKIPDRVFQPEAPAWMDAKIEEQLDYVKIGGESRIISTQIGEVFVDLHTPAPRLVIIGATQLSDAVTYLAGRLDYYSIVIDPRKAFATPERVPQADELHVCWPTDGLREINLCAEDYLLLISHDDKLDLPAAMAALDAQTAYIGMLASQKTREKRFEQLEQQGYRREQLERIHAPVGLDIGAKSLPEIALSILAEITAFRYGKLMRSSRRTREIGN